MKAKGELASRRSSELLSVSARAIAQIGMASIDNSEFEMVKCLSIQQPHADDIFFGGKWCENRSWSTSYRGELWIHACKVDTESVQIIMEDEGTDRAKESPTGLATGVILGRVNLIACVRSEKLFSVASDDVCNKILRRKPERRPLFDESDEDSRFLREFLESVDSASWRHFCFSQFAWIFSAPEMLNTPIPVKGKLRIWELEAATDRLMLAGGNQNSWK